MQKIWTCIAALCIVSAYSGQADIDTVTNRLSAAMFNANPDTASINKWVATMQADGHWTDVNYADGTVKTSFAALNHLRRILQIAVAYRSPGSPLFNNPALPPKIKDGFGYWFKTRPVHLTNWWWDSIGVPEKYGMALLLMKGHMNNDTLLHYSTYLKDRTANYAGLGKNLTWVSCITVNKGCIENNATLINNGFSAIASTMEIVNTQDPDGIKADFSMHQHHAQLNSGSYGMAMVQDIINYMTHAVGTQFIDAYPAAKKKILVDVMLNGLRLLGYRNTFDFGAVGRGITRPTTEVIPSIAPELIDKMAVIDPEHATDYMLWKEHLSGGPFSAPQVKHFFKSDILTAHGTDSYLSAKIISKRTNGTECINNENRKFFNLPLGATNILTTGTEYKGIFGLWNWARIPGTTSEDVPDLAPFPLDSGTYMFGTNEFGGGVSNGTAGMAAFEQNPEDYYKIKAKKAYFMMNGMMLCLGTEIRAIKTNPVITTMNQCLSNGDVLIGNDSTATLLTDEKLTTSTHRWIHHDNTGYILPVGGNITVQNTTQSGNWKSINETGLAKTISGKIFSLWFNHSATPSNRHYCYVVAPDRSADEMEELSRHHGFVVAQNDNSAQAVRNDSVRHYAAAFYAPATVDFGNTLTLTSDKKALVLIERKGSPTYKISVSDPIWKQAGVTLTLNKKLIGPNAVYSNGHTEITLAFPTGPDTGSTATAFYTIKEPKVTITLPTPDVTVTPGSDISIAASTVNTDSVTGIKKVEFFVDTVKVGEDASAPYTCLMNAAAEGTYTLTAKVTDNDGIQSISAPVPLTVSLSTKNLPVSKGVNHDALTGFFNPVTKHFTVKETVERVVVMNTRGQVIKTYSINGIGSVDLGALSKGIYFLKLENGLQNTTMKIVLSQ